MKFLKKKKIHFLQSKGQDYPGPFVLKVQHLLDKQQTITR